MIRTAMKDDLGKYIQRRKHSDKAFAEGFDRGFAKFKKTLVGRTPSTDRTRSPAKRIA